MKSPHPCISLYELSKLRRELYVNKKLPVTIGTIHDLWCPEVMSHPVTKMCMVEIGKDPQEPLCATCAQVLHVETGVTPDTLFVFSQNALGQVVDTDKCYSGIVCLDCVTSYPLETLKEAIMGMMFGGKMQ